MNKLKAIFRSKYSLWVLLAIPGILVLINYIKEELNYETIMHVTGEFSGRFLVISLIATPIKLMFPKGSVAKWFIRNRRFFGVSAFAYTLLHTIFYIIEYSFSKVVNEFSDIAILTGWVAFFIFIPLAITSTNAAIKRMGTAWKKLQRWVYLAAIMAFSHWALLGLQSDEPSVGEALFHFAPVMILQIYRVYKVSLSKKKPML